MPVILRNKTNAIEIDIHANLKYSASKGAFDIIFEDSGSNDFVAVYIVLRTQSIINNTIKLDWRDITLMPEGRPCESAEDLFDTLVGWNVQRVQVTDNDAPLYVNSWDFPYKINNMQITQYDSNANPLIIEYYYNLTLKFKHNLTYDSEGRIIKKELILI